MATETTGITRRDLLKRGALVGGAVLWMTPVVQVVGMGRAYAKDVSPNCTRFCLKLEFEDDDDVETLGLTCTDNGNHAYPIWPNEWEELGNGEGNALLCPSDGVNDEDAAEDITSRLEREFVVYGLRSDGLWIAFPNDIKVANLEDETNPESAGVKCGQDKQAFPLSAVPAEDDPCFTDPNGDPYRRIYIPACGNGNDISHIELIVDWCP